MITLEQFKSLFPFYFQLDAALRVVSAGTVLARICPTIVAGIKIDEVLRFSRFGVDPNEPLTREFILTQRETLFIFKSTSTPLVLRMQVVVLEGESGFFFVGSPWVRELKEMRELQLVLHDFAPHDATVDLLQLTQSIGRSLADAKRLSASLEVQRNELKTLIDTANAPILAVNNEGKVVDWNRMTERLTGFTKADAANCPFVKTFVAVGSRARAGGMIEAALRSSATARLELELQSKGGMPSLIIFSASPRHDASGAVLGATLVGQDITELGEYRNVLEQRVAERTSQLSLANAELSRAMRSKDEFLSAMSHELRTPLTAILGLSELLLSDAYGGLAEKQIKPIGTIAESGQHLLSLINDLLDVAKIGAGKVDLDRRLVDVQSMCLASIRLIAEMAQKKRLTIRTHFDPCAATLECDERRVKQILVNLLTNAVKFTHDSGELSLTTTANAEARTTTFAVQDSGIGIKPEDLKRLFTPFTQLDSNLARQYEGTGLGLTLVMALAELHGGSVTVESELGKGSCFRVTLPWHEPTNESGKVLSTSSGSSPLALDPDPDREVFAEAPLVINADDNEANRMTIHDQLVNHGFRVIDAHNGTQAVAAVFQHNPAVVVMDLQMPVMDGLTAIRLLRSNPTCARLPIVALTSRAMMGDREMCLAAGASDYASKPVNIDALIATLRRLIRESSTK